MITKIINETTNFAKSLFCNDIAKEFGNKNIIDYNINYFSYSSNNNFAIDITISCINCKNEIIASENYTFSNKRMSETTSTLSVVNQKKYTEFLKKINPENEL